MEPAVGIQTANGGRLLLVDDEEYVLRSIQRVLRRSDWEIRTAPDGETGLVELRAFRPQVVLSDFRMPGMNGVEFLARVKQEFPRTQRIMLTGQADHHAIEEAVNRSEIFRFISKPWDDAQLLLTITSAFEQVAVLEENERLYRLTQEQNQELKALNQDLEARVQQRTRLISLAKREWEKTFDAIEDPLAIVRADTLSVARANLAYARVAGKRIEQILGNTCHTYLFGRAERCAGCPLPAAIQSGQEQRGEISRGGRTYALTVYPMGEEQLAVCSYRDITDEREMTRRMVETEKMVAVGHLAGGVAHEINNPLGGILAFAQLMKRDGGRTRQDVETLSLIEESALRCKRIVESLLRISRRHREDDRRRMDLGRCVEDAAMLFKARLKGSPRARLEVKLSPKIAPVFADAGQIAQVLLNLLHNALQALPAETGTITVETGESREGCFFRVSDTGSGMDAQTRARIFEPLFTTKPPGVGTGLGLSIAYRIIEDHGGKIHVESEPGRGSTFTVVIPAAPEGVA